MTDINLRSIFCYLTNDENFLSIMVQADHKDIEQKKKKKNKTNLMANMITEYTPLVPYDQQLYAQFPSKCKEYLTPDYVRLGIKNVTEKNLNTINISFLNSLNMLLRPDLYKLSLEEHMRNLGLLETFICHKIQRNYQIDKIKNTRKVQNINKELIKNLSEGKISHELIQTVINIFEINLLVFDFSKMDVYFYWTKGHKYPYLNFFKNIYCMSYTQGNYEPLMTPNNYIPNEQKQKMYIKILEDLAEIKCMPEINLTIHSIVVLDSWDVPCNVYMNVLETYLKKNIPMIKQKLG